MNKAIFLDRDGVINEKMPEGEYVTSPSQFKILPHVLTSIKKMNDMGYKVFIVTNQRGIFRQKMTIEQVDKIHEILINQLKNIDAHIDNIYICPHDNNVCNCRKPQPGMLLAAINEFNIDIKNSYIIGDSESDIKAGNAVGCKTIFIRGNYKLTESETAYSCRNIREAVEYIQSCVKDNAVQK